MGVNRAATEFDIPKTTLKNVSGRVAHGSLANPDPVTPKPRKSEVLAQAKKLFNY